MQLSVICPTYNEIAFIDSLVDSLCTDDGLQKEILIVDGGSTDRTRDRVQSLLSKYSNLRFIDNPNRTSTEAFNIGFKSSSGTYVAFVGAHARYGDNYFRRGIEYLERGECEAVGGPLIQQGKSPTGKAIALAMSSKLGVGNTEFRTESKKMYVDSVAFAIYRRDMVEKCGLMDVSLPVNQDDEFHYRLKKYGYRILMVPEMNAIYFVRDSYRKLLKQYFRYGLYKPAVLKKIKTAIRVRHLIPSLFFLYLLTLPIAFVYNLWFAPFAAYILIIIFRAFTFKAAINVRLLAIPVFPLLHISYGSGFIIGLISNK